MGLSSVVADDEFTVAPPGDCFGTCGGSTVPLTGPSSAVVDDEFDYLDIEQFMWAVPPSIDDEHDSDAY